MENSWYPKVVQDFFFLFFLPWHSRNLQARHISGIAFVPLNTARINFKALTEENQSKCISVIYIMKCKCIASMLILCFMYVISCFFQKVLGIHFRIECDHAGNFSNLFFE